MVNTREFEWSDISLVVAGRDIKGFRGVKYSEKQEKEALYAKGNKAHCIQSGNIAYEGELTLTQSEYETLRLAMGGEYPIRVALYGCCLRQPQQGGCDGHRRTLWVRVHRGQHGVEAGGQVPREVSALRLPVEEVSLTALE